MLLAHPALAAAPQLESPRKIAGGAFKTVSHSAPALADFNADGLLDLALGGGGKAGIYFNRGTTTQPRFDRLDLAFPVADDGSMLAIDYDRDGLIDLVWRSTIFLNTGTREQPAFDEDWRNGKHLIHLKWGPLPEAYTPFRRVAFTDLNRDGRIDLVLTVFKTVPLYVAYSGRWMVAYDEGRGAEGEFGKPQWLSILTTKEGEEIEFSTHGPYAAFPDLDADGRAEFVIGTYGSGVYLPEKIGDLSWRLPAQPLFKRGSMGSYTTPATGDINADGLPDFVIGGYGGAVHITLNQGTANRPLFPAPHLLPGGEFRVSRIAGFDLTDWDGDGAADLLVGEQSSNYGDGAVKLFNRLNTSKDPQFQYEGWVHAERQGVLPNSPHCYAAPQVVDIDADGDVDLLACGKPAAYKQSRVWVYFNRDGRPPVLFQHGPINQEPLVLTDRAGTPIATQQGFNARLCDVDGDDLLDLVTGGNEVMLYRNVGRRSRPVFAHGQPLPTESEAKISGLVALGDLNGDSLVDLLTSNRGGSTIRFHENIGARTSAQYSDPVPLTADGEAVNFPGGVLPGIHDVDGDGANDVVVGVVEANEFFWMRAVGE